MWLYMVFLCYCKYVNDNLDLNVFGGGGNFLFIDHIVKTEGKWAFILSLPSYFVLLHLAVIWRSKARVVNLKILKFYTCLGWPFSM